jgi:hypothetical protein
LLIFTTKQRVYVEVSTTASPSRLHDSTGWYLILTASRAEFDGVIQLPQTLIRVLSVWPWNASIPKEVEFSCWLRNALTMSIEEGDTEANAVRTIVPLDARS